MQTQFQENGMLFTLYADGDCVVSIPNAGFVQLSSALLRRLAGNEGLEQPRTLDPRSTNVKKVETGWGCTVVDSSGQRVEYIYSSRTFARDGSPSHKIGESGRVA